jgi:hypothetical protein
MHTYKHARTCAHSHSQALTHTHTITFTGVFDGREFGELRAHVASGNAAMPEVQSRLEALEKHVSMCVCVCVCVCVFVCVYVLVV